MSDFKPTLCLDFDGVIHSYTSGWQGADVIPDAMVPGTAEFLDRAVEKFKVCIFSSRSNQPNGIMAMKFWLKLNLYRVIPEQRADEIFEAIGWPTEKPAAFVSIDDRALTFSGVWPDMDEIAAFVQWNKREAVPKADSKREDEIARAMGLLGDGA